MTKEQKIIFIACALLFGVAWVGLWGAWISHPAPALTQNAITLAEWGPYLNEVRGGSIGYAPALLRGSVSVLITGLAVVLVVIESPLLRWALRLLILIPMLWLLPPYPEITAPFALGYGPRLIVSGLALVGVLLTVFTDRLPYRLQLGLTGLCGLLSGVLAVIAFGAFQGPFAAHYDAPLTIGWGLALYVFALILVIVFVGFERVKAQQGD